MTGLFETLVDAIRGERPAALVTMVRGNQIGAKLLLISDEVAGSLGNSRLDRIAANDALRMLKVGITGTRTYGPSGEGGLDDVELFIQSFVAPPRMYIFGAIDVAEALSHIGRFLGYRVTVCDPREKFATSARFPDADEIVVRWPHEFLAHAEVDPRTVICALTHDPKFDIPLLKAALNTPAVYIGAMGSRRTHSERSKQLQERGVSEEDLRRISGPIGLDIGARSPAEVAVSIAAEIIATRTGASGER